MLISQTVSRYRVTNFAHVSLILISDQSRDILRMDVCGLCLKIFTEKSVTKCVKCSIVFCESCCEIPISFEIPVTSSSQTSNTTGLYCTKKCILEHHPQFVPETHLCEMCYRVFRENKMLKCANCAIEFCESCCEIPMDFKVPVTVRGRTRFETGHYCTEKCMRIHHPGFVICLGPVCEICHED